MLIRLAVLHSKVVSRLVVACVCARFIVSVNAVCAVLVDDIMQHLSTKPDRLIDRLTDRDHEHRKQQSASHAFDAALK